LSTKVGVARILVERKILLAAGLVTLVVVDRYAYYVLTRKQVKISKIEGIIESSPGLA
jgi:EamA domain-containing membrane protein RarD